MSINNDNQLDLDKKGAGTHQISRLLTIAFQNYRNLSTTPHPNIIFWRLTTNSEQTPLDTARNMLVINVKLNPQKGGS